MARRHCLDYALENYAKTLLTTGSEQPISSLPKRNEVESQVQPPQSATPTEGSPTLEETLNWLRLHEMLNQHQDLFRRQLLSACRQKFCTRAAKNPLATGPPPKPRNLRSHPSTP